MNWIKIVKWLKIIGWLILAIAIVVINILTYDEGGTIIG